MTKNIFFLIGPTASGKSNISLQLTRDFPFEVINADLYSVFKGMNIGTAKPNLDEFSSRHYLFNKLDPDMNYNVSEYCLDAIDSIDKVFANNKYPLITGGSMMYIYQLLNGLSHDYNILDSDKKIISYILEKYTYPEIYESLINVKEISIGKINPNDKYRIEKLLERLISPNNDKKKYKGLYLNKNILIKIIFINICDRELLRTNIFKRTSHMLKSGLIDEVENLKQKYNLTLENQSMKAIGYKQVLSYLDNNTELVNLVNSISLATQQLAKRQLTWRNKFKVDYYHNYPELDYKALHDFISKSLA
ncbi:MAG: tRNA (adenosine(37)-N6)-dimethylallyltransferase MiaA [Gammaproteobacteria bacterium]